MKKESKGKLLLVTFFAIAFGFVEATVVIYLRKIFYGVGGFNFPLKGFVDPAIFGIEFIREFATIVMLITVAMLAGKNLYENEFLTAQIKRLNLDIKHEYFKITNMPKGRDLAANFKSIKENDL